MGVAAARDNLRDLPWVEVVAARVEVALRQAAGRRAGRRRGARPAAHRRRRRGSPARWRTPAPRAVAYVACDPAAFARDVRAFRDEGWRLAALRGFDCFPMTQHVELVGLLLPAGPVT